MKIVAALWLFTVAVQALAQSNYPEQTVRILVGFTPENRETLKILAQADVRKKLNDLGLDVIAGTPAEFTSAIERELPRWAAVIKQLGIRATE